MKAAQLVPGSHERPSSLSAADVLRRIMSALPDACVVSSCGYPTRALQAEADRDANFYLVGSMGMAAPIAYGIALARPGCTVVAIDGDGSLAMNLSALVLAEQTDADVLHVVLDNGVHASTGGQRSVLPADVTAIALTAGYRQAILINDAEGLDRLDEVAAESGPRFVHAVVLPHRTAPGPRVERSPQELVIGIRNFISASQEMNALGGGDHL